jgi:hypothetical protein
MALGAHSPDDCLIGLVAWGNGAFRRAAADAKAARFAAAQSLWRTGHARMAPNEWTGI